MPRPSLLKLRLAGALLALALPATAVRGAAAAPPQVTARFDIGLCNGRYAICAAASCRRTTQSVDGKAAAECDCPVLEGLALANMAVIQSCEAPAGMVYSLYSTCEPADVAESLMQCPAGSYAQCWNALCSYADGARSARCVCPIQHGPFITPGGECDPANCSAELLVGAPFRGQPGCRLPAQQGTLGSVEAATANAAERAAAPSPTP